MMARVLLLLLTLTAMGCNVTKFLPEGKYLYQGASLEIESPDSVSTDAVQAKLAATLDQTTNSKIPLIGYRGVWRYYKFEEKKQKNPDKYADEPNEIKGEEPIFYDESTVEGISNLLENRAANNGYFTHSATHTVDTSREDREISVAYTITVGAPYLLDTVLYAIRDTAIAAIVDSIRPESYLQHRDRYNLDALKAERNRWQQAMKEAGYYYASNADFLFLADTVSGDHRVKMLAKLKTEIPREHLVKQRITRINVYPDFDVADTSDRYRLPVTEVGGLNVYCADCPLRPKILDEAFAMGAGDLYSPTDYRRSLSRLAGYNTFRYISMDFEEVPGSDTTLILNAFMEPQLRRRIDGEFGVTYNSARYIGPNVRLGYTNRNLLRGAELLQITGDFSYAVFLGSTDEIRVPTSGTYDLNASLTVPRLWLPKRRKLIPRVMTSGTVMSVGAKLEQLSLTLSGFAPEISREGLGGLAEKVENDPDASERVSLLQLRAQYGYTWQRRVKKSHLLNPFAVRFQNPVISDDEVLVIARNLGLAPGDDSELQTSRFDRMLVFSPNYTLTYDTRLDGEDAHNIFWQQYISMNFNNIFPVGPGTEEAERVTSLYPQLETDFRYYWRFSQPTSLNFRVHGGIAFPFSDRAIVPYFDLYSIGGPNSLRGFIPRELGPGRTAPRNNNLLTLGGFGNLLLEGSVELRHKVSSLIELAAFYDVGNIWTYKTELEPLDTDFRQTDFINELAMNYGLGARFDLTFLIFRVDIAVPLQIPYEETVAGFGVPQMFLGDEPDFSPRLVVAFGYPF